MKTLLIMRHGKSSWKDDKLTDIERPLAKRGRFDVPRMGNLLREEDLIPDIILCSTAKRAKETADLMMESSGFDGPIQYHRSFYHGYIGDYMDLIQCLKDDYQILMVIGHNPGVEELLSTLIEIDEWMPTASIAQLELNLDTWRSLNEYSVGELINLWRPRELS